MKLYWKIYFVLALTTLVTLLLSLWISFSVLPAHFERVRMEKLEAFEFSVMNLQNPTRQEIQILADSMNVLLRYISEAQHPPMPRGPQPGDRDMPGVRFIQPEGTDFAILASGGVVRTRFLVLALFASGLFLSQALALALGLRSVFSRISILRQVTSEFGEGNFAARYPASTGGDEIDKLGNEFNRMAEQIISLLGSHNELLNAVAHELRTPMARLSFALELARENPLAVREKLGLMERDLFELDRLVSELLEFNRIGSTGTLAKDEVSINSICLEVADGEKAQSSGIKITVSTKQGDGLTDTKISGDHRLLLRAISNLVRNSARYAKSSIDLQISLEEQCVNIIVTDDGPGFPAGLAERAANPFVKSHDSKGSGLGLSIVSRIAERHGGSLSLSNLNGGGAKAVLSLPR